MTKTDFVIDYLLCILFRLSGPLIRLLPKDFSLSLGKTIGTLVYYFDLKHRAIAYVSIKTAFGRKAPPARIAAMTRRFYRTFGENLMEIFFIPRVNKNYLKEYIEIVGRQNVDAAFKRGKGVILLAMHEGSWELSNIICAHMAFPFNFFVRGQRYPRLDNILNLYRTQQGCRVIQRGNQLRQLVQVLSKNEAIGITADQGGKRGTLVKFFGRDASMSTGAVKMALKSGATVIPCFYVRTNGPYIRVIFESPYQIRETGDRQADIRDNLQGIVSVFEKYVASYPKEYLWTYKIWKYGLDKNVLILSDGKAGHLRQAQAAVEQLSYCLKQRNNYANIDTVEVKFKNKFSRAALAAGICLSGKYQCQGCLSCLKKFLDEDSYDALSGKKYEFIVSCGSSLAPVNLLLGRENLARSITVMRPPFPGAPKFDLVVMPRHDRPQARSNVVSSEGALNLINDVYLAAQAKQLAADHGLDPNGLYIGLFIGGDSKKFRLEPAIVSEAIKQLKQTADELGAQVLVTTSRRTPPQIEAMVEKEFAGYPRCRLLVVANKKNIPGVVGGILGLCGMAVVSPESISMVSEAASSKKYTLVFEAGSASARHRRFLEHFVKNKYIYLVPAAGLGNTMKEIWKNKPRACYPDDGLRVREAVKFLV